MKAINVVLPSWNVQSPTGTSEVMPPGCTLLSLLSDTQAGGSRQEWMLSSSLPPAPACGMAVWSPATPHWINSLPHGTSCHCLSAHSCCPMDAAASWQLPACSSSRGPLTPPCCRGPFHTWGGRTELPTPSASTGPVQLRPPKAGPAGRQRTPAARSSRASRSPMSPSGRAPSSKTRRSRTEVSLPF